MYAADEIIDLVLENIKRIYFPQNWLQFDLKFSKSEMFALLFMQKKGEVTMTELSEHVNAPMSTANGLAERLLKKGYIVRDRSETDRRIVTVRLTDAGVKLIADIRGIASEYVTMALKELSEEEIHFLMDIVTRIIGSFQKSAGAEQSSAGSQIKKIEIE
jgi:DNA-binding MarR family transcriptional regulator